jgi:hypothetical protein
MPAHNITFHNFHSPTVYEIANIHKETIKEVENLLSRHVYTINDLKNHFTSLTNIRDFCIKHPGYHELQFKTEVLWTTINNLLSEFSPIQSIITRDNPESSFFTSAHNIQVKQSTKIIFSFLAFDELIQAKKASRLWSISANETVINPNNIITKNKTIVNLSHLSRKPTLFQLNNTIKNVLTSYWEKSKFWKSTQDRLGAALENMEMENKQHRPVQGLLLLK